MNKQENTTTRKTAQKMGELALRYCKLFLPLEVLRSNAGYYIGTYNNASGPCSRESVEYFRTEEAAALALAIGNWTQRDEP